MKSLLKKYAKSNYQVDDFGRGKSPTAKARNKRAIKRKAKARLASDTKKTDL